MQKAELDKLLHLTAIELSPGQESVFLDYFSGMKQMFDDFRTFPLDIKEESFWEENVVVCFDTLETFSSDPLLKNVQPERMVNRAIEVTSALGE